MVGLENNISVSTLLEQAKNCDVNKKQESTTLKDRNPWSVPQDACAHADGMVEMEKGGLLSKGEGQYKAVMTPLSLTPRTRDLKATGVGASLANPPPLLLNLNRPLSEM